MRYVLEGAVMGIVLCIGFALGVWWQADVDAYVQRPAVVEGEPLRDPRCGRDVWVVGVGDTLWDIASLCFDGHTGQRVADIRAANPGVDPGRLRYGDVLTLPERGR